MFRKSIFTLSLLVSFTALVVSGCSNKKAPASPSSEDVSSATPTEANPSPNLDNSSLGNGTVDMSSLPTVYFGFNEYTIPADGREKLKMAAEALKKLKTKVTVEGHCDERGSSEYNLALGEKRAQSVKGYLQKLGVPSDKMATISYGKERPAVQGSGEEAWAKNRRGEFVVNR